MTTPQPPDYIEIFDQNALTQPPKKDAWKLMVPLSIVLAAVMYVAWHFGWDAKAVGAGVLLVAVLSKLLLWLVGVVGLIPIVGPLIVKVLSLSVIWLLNAIGYIVSIIAIKRGYSKDVLTYRGLTIALIIGIIIGYVIGHFA